VIPEFALARTILSHPPKHRKGANCRLNASREELLLTRFTGLRKKEAEFTDGSLKSIILVLVTSF
jgi:hypothetical protein